MVANVHENIRVALEGLPVTELNGWPNGRVALVWIGGGGRTNSLWRIWFRRYVITQRLHRDMFLHKKTGLISQAEVVILRLVRFGGRILSGWQIVNAGLLNKLSSPLWKVKQCWKLPKSCVRLLLMTLIDYVVLEKFELRKAMTICPLVHDLCTVCDIFDRKWVAAYVLGKESSAKLSLWRWSPTT